MGKIGRILSFTLITVFLVFAASLAYAQGEAASREDVLISILVKKGILTQEEAKAIEAEAEATQKKHEQKIVEDIKTKGLAVPNALKGLSISGLGYIDYSVGEIARPGNKETNLNKFTLTRGYLTIQKNINDWMSGRITSDITRLSTNGDPNNSDWEYRIKYLYVELRPHDIGGLTNMQAEFGQGHNPWLDFEESINPTRAQGTMAVERAGVFNSADLGVSLRGNIYGKLADAKAKTGNSHYDGFYGSWHLGVYNGGGYHNDEANSSKALEGRLSIRPLPELVPGLQLSYLGMFGKGNKSPYTSYEPNYIVNMGMLSLENPLYILTAQYFQTTGNAAGTWVTPDNDELRTEGVSVFGRVKMPFITERLGAFARYDYFNQDKDNKIAHNAHYNMYITGLSYDLYKDNIILADFESVDYGSDAGLQGAVPKEGNRLGNNNKFQVVYQLSF